MIPYNRLFLAILIVCGTINCLAQEIVEKRNKLTDWVTEEYYVSKADQQTKNGAYHAFYRRKTLIAEGTYIDGKRTGVWNFFSTRGNLLQKYNFNKDSLEYEAREKLPSDFHYFIDKTITDSARVTKPLKIGGRYYGFLPYLNVFKTPFSAYGTNTELYVAVVELLISPMGRLAAYKVRLIAPILEYDQTINLSLNLFNEEDKRFIPATFNHTPILSRIIIKCRLTDDGGLDFY